NERPIGVQTAFVVMVLGSDEVFNVAELLRKGVSFGDILPILGRRVLCVRTDSRFLWLDW
ncbi:MAG: hypothetical protein VCD00_09645, partial [Candidatus Hydrogenedentota bacterium]